ncbi:MAG: arginine--tRNA ligase [Lachnospiraceae bacterium]|nr:arginine--tRNA ligase [Lachnospiraceae bacterium]
MKDISEILTEILEKAFEKAGYDPSFSRVGISNRPDLCEYQCNGAMAAAKQYHKAPLAIAEDVAAQVKQAAGSAEVIGDIAVAPPGFININVSPEYLASHLTAISAEPALGVKQIGKGKKYIFDYGGPNVAKPLHIGHLRSAIIGEALKRIYRFCGYEVIGDVHLGDWGLQMGLIIEETRRRMPDLCYFDSDYSDQYPSEAPFTISDLEEIYPTASARSKEDAEFAAAAHEATAKLQYGEPGYRALFEHIIRISVADLKKNYANLDVDFDLWKGESDVQKYIPDMIDRLIDDGFAHESEGALVIDVAQPGDAKELPPCLIRKSDGASLYATTDLATLLERERDYSPDGIVYIVDKRQGMHFQQVFRAAKKSGIAREDTLLYFLGFGTMNGKDGKPFKTREGGVMRLEQLIADINEAVYERIMESSPYTDPDEARKNAALIGLAAIKYGDLSNQPTKDYIFDLERFVSFEGNTGPYILYTIVRINSILKKYAADGGSPAERILPAGSASEKTLQLLLSRMSEALEGACTEYAPNRVCQYIYEISNAFNSFYHETKILAEADENKKTGYIALLKLTERVLSQCINLLGFEAPERM